MQERCDFCLSVAPYAPTMQLNSRSHCYKCLPALSTFLGFQHGVHGSLDGIHGCPQFVTSLLLHTLSYYPYEKTKQLFYPGCGDRLLNITFVYRCNLLADSNANFNDSSCLATTKLGYIQISLQIERERDQTYGTP